MRKNSKLRIRKWTINRKSVIAYESYRIKGMQKNMNRCEMVRVQNSELMQILYGLVEVKVGMATPIMGNKFDC